MVHCAVKNYKYTTNKQYLKHAQLMLSKRLLSVYENRNSSACKILVAVSQRRAQWLRGRASYSRLREPGFESWLRC